MSRYIKIAIFALVLIGVLFLFRLFGIQEWIRTTLDSVATMGFVGIIIFFALYVLACVFLIPGSLLTLGAGFIFGVVKGSIIVSISSVTGATAAFVIGRYFARGWVERKVSAHAKFAAIDSAVAKEGWKIVGLTRLSPVFPFNLLNYAFGLTQVSLRDYFLASWIGMIPGTVMYVYLGSLAGSLATLGVEGGTKSPAEWLLYGIGLLATVVVTLYVTRIAKKALEDKAL